MDFKRIQKVLLAVFVFLNLFLAHELRKRHNTQTGNSATNVIMNLEQTLNEDNIKIAHELSDEAFELPMLKADNSNSIKEENLTLDTERVDAKITQTDSKVKLEAVFSKPLDLPIDINKETKILETEDAEKIRDELLLDEGLFTKGYKYTHWLYDPVQRILTFRMATPTNRPLVDGTGEIRMQLNDNYQVSGYTQTYQDGFLSLDNQKLLITAKEAIAKLEQRMDTALPKEATIEATTLSYYCSSRLRDFSVYSPAWEIVYTRSDNSTQTALVDAMRGTVVSFSQ